MKKGKIFLIIFGIWIINSCLLFSQSIGNIKENNLIKSDSSLKSSDSINKSKLENIRLTLNQQNDSLIKFNKKYNWIIAELKDNRVVIGIFVTIKNDLIVIKTSELSEVISYRLINKLTLVKSSYTNTRKIFGGIFGLGLFTLFIASIGPPYGDNESNSSVTAALLLGGLVSAFTFSEIFDFFNTKMNDKEEFDFQGNELQNNLEFTRLQRYFYNN